MPVEFSYLLRHSYKEYLEQQYLKENIDVVVSKNVREAVGSIEDIYKRNTDRLCAGLTDIQYRIDQTNDSLEIISFDLDRIVDSLDVINSNIVSGFQALFVKFDELGESLAHIGQGVDKLVEIARTPVQTWALNQYEIACDAVRRKLFPEALEALRLAVDGNGQQTGYKTDFRFHQLRGILLLGIPGEPDTIDLVDLKAAEQAFLLAARYAQHDHKTEAAQGLVGAGKAAYADGRPFDANKHNFGAVKLDPRCGEANYQLARLAVEASSPDAMQHFLEAAFDIHWSFAIRAGADVQFSEHRGFVAACAQRAAKKIASEIQPEIDVFEKKVRLFERSGVAYYPPFQSGAYETMQYVLAGAKEALNVGLLKPVFDMRVNIPSFTVTVRQCANRYCDELMARSENIISAGTDNGATEYLSVPDRSDTVSKIGAWIAGISVFLAMTQLGPGGGFSKAAPFLIFGAVAFVGLPTGYSLIATLEKSDLKRRKERNNRIRDANSARLWAEISNIKKAFEV